MTEHIPCARCTLTAFRLVGDCVQITARHNSQWHITTVSLGELEDRVEKGNMRRLLDKIGVPVLE